MAHDLHGDRRVNPSPTEIGGRTMPKVMEAEVFDPCRLLRSVKGRLDTLDGFTFVEEYVFGIEATDLG
jgi:hypothetical protein